MLDVDNGMEQDAYVTLAVGPSLVLGLYVRSGSKAHVEGVADATYDLYYATGDGWNSDLLAFTSHAGYTKFDDPLPYVTTSKQYKSWTVKLDARVDGNASVSKVAASEVPR